MALFDPESYRRYRVAYPPELFRPMNPLLANLGSGLTLVDLGAGTGISTVSFLRCFQNLRRAILVDPDPRMLAEADFSAEFPEVDALKICSPVEELSIGALSIEAPADIVLVGSAWHWMRASEALDRISQILRPGGVFGVFEYQMPKARGSGNAELLNEWVRRQFNQFWRAPAQVPRGTLDELLRPVREHSDFFFRSKSRVSREVDLSLEEWRGVLVSQSRYLNFEAALGIPEREGVRAETLNRARGFWGRAGELSFEYRFEARFFQRRAL